MLTPQKIKQLFLKNIYLILLIIIGVVVSLLNFTPGTYLSGWDTLHPEFDFPLNIERVVYGVFRTEQGLGTVAAHAHMSDLPRILYLYIASFIFNVSFLRYFFMFSMLILGPIGMYLFLRDILFHKAGDKLNINNLIAFVGAVFYMFNLGTVQQFIVPFEMFITAYGFIPVLFWASFKYLLDNSKDTKYLLVFSILSFLASPMAYAFVQWYIFFGLISLIWISYLIINRTRKVLSRVILLILGAILTNIYWILPNLYFLKNHSSQIQDANINKLFSEQAFLYNKEFGNLSDVLTMKSFLFDWSIYNGGNFQDLMLTWINHLNNPIIMGFGYLFAVLMLIGLIGILIKKHFLFLGLSLVTIIVLIFLFNDNFPTRFIFNFLQNTFPLFKESLRFPHNKVYIIYMFLFTTFFSYGIYFGINTIRNLTTLHRSAYIGILSAIFLMILAFNAPYFTGNLISPYMRIKIPDEYFQLFKYMNRKDSGRIAVLPVHSFWGWEYHDWKNTQHSYQGAGFIWFGLKQPVLHRDFDRWNPLNEQAYRELSHAVYSENDDLLYSVANKYNIKYFLLDESIVEPDTDSKVLYYKELKSLLSDSRYFIKDNNFDFLSIYEVNNTKNESLVESIGQTINKTSTKISSNPVDNIYYRYGNYLNQGPTVFDYDSLYDNQYKLLNNSYSINTQGIQLNPKTTTKNALQDYLSSEEYVLSDLILQKNGSELTADFYPFINTALTNKSESLSLTANIPDQSSVLMSINNDTYEVNGIQDNTPIAYTNIQLSLKKNNINIYDPNSNQIKIFKLNSDNHTLSPCESTKGSQEYGINFENNLEKFRLFAKNTPLCLTLPISSQGVDLSKYPNNLLNISVKLSEDKIINNGNDRIKMCLVDLDTGNCIIYSTKKITNKKTFASDRNLSLPLVTQNNYNLGLKIILDATQDNKLTQASFDQIGLELRKPSESFLLSGPQVATAILNTSNTDSKGYLVNYSGKDQLSSNIANLPRSDGSCNQSPLTKQNIKKNQIYFDNYIRYESENGSQCDHISFPSLSHTQSYLLEVVSRNITGIPLTLCVTNNYTKRCDIYTQLDPNKEFESELFFIPSTTSSQAGYDVNISNLGIKGTPAINDLRSVQFIPYPYKYLSDLYSGPSLNLSSDIKKVSYSFNNPVNIYAKDATNNIVLNYSYEPGWRLYDVNSNNILGRLFPFFLGKSIGEHMMLNSWSNIWLINKSTEDVVIVFMPQYLLFIGLLISLIYIIILIIIKAKKLLTDH